MDMNLYCVYDRVAEQCGPLYEAKNDAVACRNFKAMMAAVPKVDLDAFDLIFLGTMDKDTMKIVVLDTPRTIEIDMGAINLEA